MIALAIADTFPSLSSPDAASGVNAFARRTAGGARVIAELSLATLMVLLNRADPRRRLYSVARLLRVEARESAAHVHPLSLRGFGATLIVILSLNALHGRRSGSTRPLSPARRGRGRLREAVYFSTVTYGAIGYDDAAMAQKWKLVSAIEGINGIILIGWSTAFFVMIVARMRRRT